jgi:hypothetical protein
MSTENAMEHLKKMNAMRHVEKRHCDYRMRDGAEKACLTHASSKELPRTNPKERKEGLMVG